MMDAQQVARPHVVDVDLNYAGHMDYAPEAFTGPPDAAPAERIKSNLKLEPHQVSIIDGGGAPSDTDLDLEGFALVHRPTEITDFRDQEQVKAIYFPEISKLLKELVGAEYVAFPFTDGTYRSSRPAPGDSSPAPFPHVDYTEVGMINYLDRAFPTRPKNVRRWAVYNLWRMLSPTGPVDVPLAVLDARTLKPKDKVPVLTHYHDIGSVESMALRYNPDHRWTFYSRMQRDDMLIFKTYDSDPATYNPVGHSAFRDPAVDTAVRSSFEMRAYVCWYD